MPEFLTRQQWDEWAKAPSSAAVDPLTIPALRKFGGCEIVKQDVDPSTGMTDVTFVISTPVQDRDDDIIDVDGWELENYQKNPVVLWGHDYRALPVGRSTKVWQEDGRLLSTDRFTPQEVNPFGHMVYQMVKGKFLKATSVGFRPLTYVFNDEHKGYDFQTQELMEHSIVPVPSNPEALVAAAAKGIDLTPLREWAEKILDDDPDSDTVALWLPKAVIEQLHGSLSNVALSLTDTSTGEGIVTGDFTTEGGTVKDAPVTPTVADINVNIEPSEEVMEEAIQALSDVIRELREAVDKLPELVVEAVVAKLAESTVKTEPPEGDAEMTEDDIKTIVEGAVDAALTATTGKLPD